MQVPLPLFSIYPGERAAELGDEVVAPRVVAVPPAAGDALGAGDERELGFFHRPNFVQEPCRPRAGLHELVRIPFAGLDAAPGVLRAVIGIGGDAMDRVAPQTRLQALEELRPVLGLRRTVARKPPASAAEQSEVAGLERDGFDRLRELERAQLFAQQLRQTLGIARRRPELHLYHAARAIVVREAEREPTHAGVARSEQPFELREKAPRREQQPFGMRHLGGKLAPRPEFPPRDERRSRRRQLSQRAVELLDQRLPPTLREPVARQA